MNIEDIWERSALHEYMRELREHHRRLNADRRRRDRRAEDAGLGAVDGIDRRNDERRQGDRRRRL